MKFIYTFVDLNNKNVVDIGIVNTSEKYNCLIKTDLDNVMVLVYNNFPQFRIYHLALVEYDEQNIRFI